MADPSARAGIRSLRFLSAPDARDTAAQLARAEWRLTGQPTGVRVCTAFGWETVWEFGLGAPSAARAS